MNKRYYESYIIIDGNLEDTAIEEEIKKYENLFKKNEIDLKNTDRIGRRRLAYSIKKRLNGFYVCFEIYSSPELIAKLERNFILNENILRYLTIFMSSKSIKEKEDHLKNKALLLSKIEETKAEALKDAEKETVAEPVSAEIEEVKS